MDKVVSEWSNSCITVCVCVCDYMCYVFGSDDDCRYLMDKWDGATAYTKRIFKNKRKQERKK